MTPVRERAPRPSSPCAGFTLVEALVALALTGLVLSGLALVTGQLLPGWNRGLGAVQKGEAIALAVDRISADLAAALYVPAYVKARRPLFAGTAEAVTFVRPAFGPNAGGGLEVVRYGEAGDARAAVLARATAPFLPRPKDAPGPDFGRGTVLLAPPYRAAFSYAGRDGVWRAEWTDADELPRAVRIVIRDGASGRALGASTAAVIHADIAPECVADEARKGCGRSGAKAGAAQPEPPR